GSDASRNNRTAGAPKPTRLACPPRPHPPLRAPNRPGLAKNRRRSACRHRQRRPRRRLAFTWAAKEDLIWIYDSSVDRAHAHRRLLWWYGFVADHPVPELVRLATTISAWEDDFL